MEIHPDRPVPTTRCPLCGGPNGCSVAAAGRFDTPCWCTDVPFPPALLGRLAPGARGTACICRACAKPSEIEAATRPPPDPAGG
ncbi:MAG: cysteine-rich CWC family protein [Rubrivivax sp.]